jgi:hypothetical protein
MAITLFLQTDTRADLTNADKDYCKYIFRSKWKGWVRRYPELKKSIKI